MRVAIASEGREVSSKVSGLCGRAPFFILFNKGVVEKVIENPFREQRGGAGVAVGELFVKEGVEIVLAGEFGFKLENVLKENGINYKAVSGKKVEEALELV